ncbi:DNA replication licensing factor MCM2, putative [Ixodes scapularis]|uniref:DNA replication licensing factor MCM2, putative n=1 Tax=Ixodes scapularis TaxID=6945 RepID=B7QIH9_IXOSC|nr:DNA replication licensing factor MCM2, putative [Ixodes scapularis]|eukprot:XP_002414986.1 DNA replication licensing factor MCM2, putative [Ixodes scapularis]
MDASTATSDLVVSVDDIECLGCSSMDENVRSFRNSAADQERTLEENRAACFREEILIKTERTAKVRASTTGSLLQVFLVKFYCFKCNYTQGTFIQYEKQELEPGSCPECQSLGPFTFEIRQVQGNKCISNDRPSTLENILPINGLLR